jgi:hypothetical protein
LSVGDGPEGIEIYTSEERGVVDWSSTFPAVYVHVAMNGVAVNLGPFRLPAIYDQLAERLGAPKVERPDRGTNDEFPT